MFVQLYGVIDFELPFLMKKLIHTNGAEQIAQVLW